jgi:hypothetical protein
VHLLTPQQEGGVAYMISFGALIVAIMSDKNQNGIVDIE